MVSTNKKLRIGFGGMSIEASNFSPHRSGFEAFNFTRRDALMARYSFLQPGSANYNATLDGTFDAVPLVHARSLPGGIVELEVYEALKTELLERIHAYGPFDGFYLDIHGAMTVQGMQDAEGELATAVRRALDHESRKAGLARCLISATMDLHGNVTRTLVEACDLITCYRMAPHEDEQDTKDRALTNLIKRLEDGTGAPHKAFVQIPVLLPGEKTSTRLDPAKSLYESLETIEAQEGIVDASLWVGYAWADEPRCYATAVVTGDNRNKAEAAAAKLAQDYWDAREAFEFVAPAADLEVCIDAALAPNALRPYIISDSGDNPTAGGSGDVTWTLTHLVRDSRLTSMNAPRTVVASIFDATAVAECFEAGLGATVNIEAGARVDSVHSPAVRLNGSVYALTEGDATSGRIAVIQIGGIHAIVTERRKPYHTLNDFHLAGIAVEDFDVVIVKIGYLEPELYELAADWMLGLTPGGVDQNLLRLGHKKIQRPMYPFDPDMDTPEMPIHTFEAKPASTRAVALEIAVQSPEDAQRAKLAGADRVELCSALNVGGLTPSFGAIRNTVKLGIPVHILIRPRPGGYWYSDSEVQMMLDDITTGLELGAAGVVIGALAEDEMSLDKSVLAKLVKRAISVNPDAEVTIHRCVDVLLENGVTAQALVEDLVELRVDRVLSSGGAQRSIDGVETLTAMYEHAAGRIQIQAGGGIRVQDVRLLTHLDAVHASARSTGASGRSGPGGGDDRYIQTSTQVAISYREALELS